MAKSSLLNVLFTPLGMIGAGAAVYGLAKQHRKKKLRKSPTSRADSPFVDKECTVLGDEARLEKWWKAQALPLSQKAMEENPLAPDDDHQTQVMKVASYTTAALANLPAACTPIAEHEARRQLYKAVWCNIAVQLSLRGLIDEEPEDLLFRCAEPLWNPLDQSA